VSLAAKKKTKKVCMLDYQLLGSLAYDPKAGFVFSVEIAKTIEEVRA